MLFLGFAPQNRTCDEHAQDHNVSYFTDAITYLHSTASVIVIERVSEHFTKMFAEWHVKNYAWFKGDFRSEKVGELRSK